MATVEIEEHRLIARYRPERSAAIAGMGCATALLGLLVLGIVEAIREPSAGAILSLPCTGVFVLAFAVLGLTRGVTEVDRARRWVITERRFLGLPIRRDVLPYGRPVKVVIDTLGQDRRPFSLISVVGEERQAEVITDYDPHAARRFADRLAAHLGVGVEERIESARVTPLPETPEA